jgi:exopolysaccharide production protein ExoZ
MKRSRYYYGLDIIRFVAAMAVIGFHFGYGNEIADFGVILPATWFGWIGVEVFFVISGFVIANSANGASPTQFLRGRVLRLYPAVWCCATIALLVRMPDGLILSYLRSMALSPKGPWISAVYWTLAVEIAFYTLIFGLLCLKGFSLLNRVALVLTISSSAYLSILHLHVWAISEQMNVFLLRHGCFFALGLWLWLSTTRPLWTWEFAAVAVSIVSCVAEICLTGSEFLPRQILGPGWIVGPVLIWSAGVLCIYLSSKTDSLLAPRAAAFVRVIGLMTYPLYLVHDKVGKRVIGDLISMGVNKWTAFAFGALSVIFLSWVICIYWEPPARRVLAFVFDRAPRLGRLLLIRARAILASL